MTQPSRTIRVFISSTFRDMQAERDHLVKVIFPQLRKLCESRAVAWTEVDLRWGITEAESSEGKVLPLCLAEIERCRPYFIGMLGQRYGWVPEEISAKLLEEQPWLKEHLHQSVTELEIIHGVLKSPVMRDRSIFYFRDPKYLDRVPAEKKADFTAENDDCAAKLASLKQRIRDEHCQGKLTFAPRENYPTPEALGELILADFTAIIDQRYPADKVPDPLDQEAARHEAYARSRRLAFVGREDLLRQMTDHVAVAGGKPLVLTGDSGCGKSALLAEWLAGWRKEHPEDLVIQHYIGSTPESADWQGLVRRILGELKRAFQIPDELAMQPDALRAALNDWLVKAAGRRRIVLVLDALNQLTDADAAHQLGWLPFVFPPNVRVLVSSLAGDALDAVRRRGWPELAVPLFAKADIAPAARAYFKLFAKTPDDRMLRALEATPAATNALYLRAVLDELRQFGDHEKLPERTAWYLDAKDLPSLFDRILTRWHDDFGKDPGHPDLVRRSLCLVACSRFGLAEGELLNLLGKAGQPLPRRNWTPFHLAAENALSIRAGLLNFGHDYLRAAVHQRWLADEQAGGEFRGHLAGYFGRITEPTDRKLDELPTLLRDTGQWESLKDLLAQIPTFLCLHSNQRWKWELHGFWIPLQKHFDPGEVYRESLAAWEVVGLPEDCLANLLNEVAGFHLDAGSFGLAEPLFRRALESREQVLGPGHPDTVTSMSNLALLLYTKGDYTGAEPLFQRALESRERILGPEHLDTLVSVSNLAGLLYGKGDYAGAEPLFRRALDAGERVLGPEHPHTLVSMSNLAGLLFGKGDYAGAEPLFRRALESRERVLGPEHPDTLKSANNLAALLESKGDYAGAEPLYRRTLESRERVLGPEHPQTLTSVDNLAGLLDSRGDYADAEPLHRRALEASDRVLGPEHPDTLTSVSNLALLLKRKGDYAGAEPLSRRAIEGWLRISAGIGRPHPNLNKCVGNYVGLLLKMGRSEAQIMAQLNKVLRPFGMSMDG